MLAFGCILIGLGIGLILGNIQETVVLSLVGLIAGGLLSTKMGIYTTLKINKNAKSVIYIIVGILVGVVVGFVTKEFIGSIITGIGLAIVSLNIRYFRKFKKINGNKLR